jgi:hypothetical protein
MHLVHTYIAYRVSISVVYIVVVLLYVPGRHIYLCVLSTHTNPLTRYPVEGVCTLTIQNLKHEFSPKPFKQLTRIHVSSIEERVSDGGSVSPLESSYPLSSASKRASKWFTRHSGIPTAFLTPPLFWNKWIQMDLFQTIYSGN